MQTSEIRPSGRGNGKAQAGTGADNSDTSTAQTPPKSRLKSKSWYARLHLATGAGTPGQIARLYDLDVSQIYKIMKRQCIALERDRDRAEVAQLRSRIVSLESRLAAVIAEMESHGWTPVLPGGLITRRADKWA